MKIHLKRVDEPNPKCEICKSYLEMKTIESQILFFRNIWFECPNCHAKYEIVRKKE